MNAVEGRGDQSEAAQEPIAPADSEYLGGNPDSSYGQQDAQVCSIEKNTLINCLNNSSDCQWAVEMLNKCKQTSEQRIYN